MTCLDRADKSDTDRAGIDAQKNGIRVSIGQSDGGWSASGGSPVSESKVRVDAHGIASIPSWSHHPPRPFTSAAAGISVHDSLQYSPLSSSFRNSERRLGSWRQGSLFGSPGASPHSHSDKGWGADWSEARDREQAQLRSLHTNGAGQGKVQRDGGLRTHFSPTAPREGIGGGQGGREGEEALLDALRQALRLGGRARGARGSGGGGSAAVAEERGCRLVPRPPAASTSAQRPAQRPGPATLVSPSSSPRPPPAGARITPQLLAAGTPSGPHSQPRAPALPRTGQGAIASGATRPRARTHSSVDEAHRDAQQTWWLLKPKRQTKTTMRRRSSQISPREAADGGPRIQLKDATLLPSMKTMNIWHLRKLYTRHPNGESQVDAEIAALVQKLFAQHARGQGLVSKRRSNLLDFEAEARPPPSEKTAEGQVWDSSTNEVDLGECFEPVLDFEGFRNSLLELGVLLAPTSTRGDKTAVRAQQRPGGEGGKLSESDVKAVFEVAGDGAAGAEGIGLRDYARALQAVDLLLAHHTVAPGITAASAGLLPAGSCGTTAQGGERAGGAAGGGAVQAARVSKRLRQWALRSRGVEWDCGLTSRTAPLPPPRRRQAPGAAAAAGECC